MSPSKAFKRATDHASCIGSTPQPQEGTIPDSWEELATEQSEDTVPNSKKKAQASLQDGDAGPVSDYATMSAMGADKSLEKDESVDYDNDGSDMESEESKEQADNYASNLVLLVFFNVHADSKETRSFSLPRSVNELLLLDREAWDVDFSKIKAVDYCSIGMSTQVGICHSDRVADSASLTIVLASSAYSPDKPIATCQVKKGQASFAASTCVAICCLDSGNAILPSALEQVSRQKVSMTNLLRSTSAAPECLSAFERLARFHSGAWAKRIDKDKNYMEKHMDRLLALMTTTQRCVLDMKFEGLV